MKIHQRIKPNASLRVPEQAGGSRLDHVLRLLLPENSRRGIQQLIRTGSVRVDGRIRPKGYRVAPGQEVILELSGPYRREFEDDLLDQVVMVQVARDFAAVCKPGGMHTESQLSTPHPALETLLPKLFPDHDVQLLNRLDQATSGLVLLALNHQAVQEYVRMQDMGKTVKSYLAVVHGLIDQEGIVRTALDTCKRREVRALQTLDPNPLRWTAFQSLDYSASNQMSLVQVHIRKGRRHQIRAHMAAVGHPVVGDHVYGPTAQGPLLLHHWKIRFPGFEAQSKPQWPEWEGRIAGVLTGQGGL
ncbi:MAG: RluA family pseudouridine synthase [Desulfovermiculus sp.]|nr:RluA family pseudouridine synthase [Desulfovermiculus sp.]